MPGTIPNDPTAAPNPTSIADAYNTSTSTAGGTTGAPATPGGTFLMTDGWYVAIACAVGFATADTRVGPIVAGILTVALIFQLTLLLQGK